MRGHLRLLVVVNADILVQLFRRQFDPVLHFLGPKIFRALNVTHSDALAFFVQKELDAGLRVTRPFGVKAELEPGRFFILGGQKAAEFVSVPMRVQ